jgi:FlaA1/EpsC-like NDP-sugar epimerase
MELNPCEAIKNNIKGTRIVSQAAIRHKVERFVLISSDKAVNPSSVMGASKRIAERCVLGLPRLRRSMTDFRAVRFGNVLASAGSVVPLFERQIAAGGPVADLAKARRDIKTRLDEAVTRAMARTAGADG